MLGFGMVADTGQPDYAANRWRSLAERLAAKREQTPQTAIGGIASVGRALLGNYADRRAAAAEGESAAAADRLFAAALGSGKRGDWIDALNNPTLRGDEGRFGMLSSGYDDLFGPKDAGGKPEVKLSRNPKTGQLDVVDPVTGDLIATHGEPFSAPEQEKPVHVSRNPYTNKLELIYGDGSVRIRGQGRPEGSEWGDVEETKDGRFFQYNKSGQIRWLTDIPESVAADIEHTRASTEKTREETADIGTDNAREDRKLDMKDRHFKAEQDGINSRFAETLALDTRREDRRDAEFAHGVAVDLTDQDRKDRELQARLDGNLKSGQTINLSNFEDPFMKSYGSQLAEHATKLSTDADSARDLLSSIDVMEAAIADPNFMSGPLQDPYIDTFRGLAERFGIVDDGTNSANELFRAISHEAILKLVGGSLGHQISNSDREFIKQMMANLNVSPEGNRKILAVMKLLSQRQIETERAWGDYFGKMQSSEDKSMSYLHFRKMWQDETEKPENILFTDQFKADLDIYANTGEWPVTNEEVDAILEEADRLREEQRLADAAGMI